MNLPIDLVSQKKPLFLIMQKHWFNEIEAGRKIIEYRSNSLYYQKRFYNFKNYKAISYKKYDTVILQVGYHTGARRMILVLNKIKLVDNFFNLHLGEIKEKINF